MAEEKIGCPAQGRFRLRVLTVVFEDRREVVQRAGNQGAVGICLFEDGERVPEKRFRFREPTGALEHQREIVVGRAGLLVPRPVTGFRGGDGPAQEQFGLLVALVLAQEVTQVGQGIGGDGVVRAQFRLGKREGDAQQGFAIGRLLGGLESQRLAGEFGDFRGDRRRIGGHRCRRQRRRGRRRSGHGLRGQRRGRQRRPDVGNRRRLAVGNGRRKFWPAY